MELFSQRFKNTLLATLNNKNRVLEIMTLKLNPFCNKIKERPVTKIFYLKKIFKKSKKK